MCNYAIRCARYIARWKRRSCPRYRRHVDRRVKRIPIVDRDAKLAIKPGFMVTRYTARNRINKKYLIMQTEQQCPLRTRRINSSREFPILSDRQIAYLTFVTPFFLFNGCHLQSPSGLLLKTGRKLLNIESRSIEGPFFSVKRTIRNTMPYIYSKLQLHVVYLPSEP